MTFKRVWLLAPALLLLLGLSGWLPGRFSIEDDVGTDDGDLGGARVTIEDDHLAAIAKLDPSLRAAVRAAASDASSQGIAVRVTSGWRSTTYQQRLLDEAIDKYGSLAEARRWVSTPSASRHVSGEAIDIGPTDAAYWMAQHGPDYGLCQVYANEIWHYELLTEPGGHCPALLPDSGATQNSDSTRPASEVSRLTR
jgi:zinc D-Ala-D-Ala carboxypeptidase